MFQTLIEELEYFLEYARDFPNVKFKISPFDTSHIVIEMIDEDCEFATSPVLIDELLAVLE